MLLGVLLVLVSSALHAVWNLLAKASGASGTAFVWLYSALVTPVLLGLLLARAATGHGALDHGWAAVLSAALHTAYALVLQRGYAVADLGVVYPLSRAGAPVLVALAAAPLAQGGTPPLVWLGIATTAVGVLLLAGGGRRPGAAALAASSATATSIAAYTLWDGYAVSHLQVDVASYLAIASLAQFGVLSVVAAAHPERLGPAARTYWRLALPVAALVPLSYGLVLVALEHVDVEVVAALRSTSILAAAVLGWLFLGEARTARRAGGAAVLAAGVAVSALGA